MCCIEFQEADVETELDVLEARFPVSDVLLFRALAERSMQAPAERINGPAQEASALPDAKCALLRTPGTAWVDQVRVQLRLQCWQDP